MRSLLPCLIITGCASVSSIQTTALDQMPPPALDVSPVVPGQMVDFELTGANPGERVYVGMSTVGQGVGPCVGGAGLLCLDIRRPQLLGTVFADVSGTANLSINVPSSVPGGVPISFQAVVVRGASGASWEKTPTVNLVTESIALPVQDMEAGDLLITEIMRNPDEVTDASGEWFEIYNASGEDADLQGLQITDFGSDDITIGQHLFLAAGEYLVVGRNADFTTNGGVNVDFEADVLLGNGDDELHLVSSSGIIDSVAWDTVSFPTQAGASMSLDPGFFGASDNDAGVRWCPASSPYGGDLGTPGAANDACDWFQVDDLPTTVCVGDHQPPTIAAGPDAFLVGCQPTGGQSTTGGARALDGVGNVLAEWTWSGLNGYYYSPITVNYANGSFQRIYHYNCASGDSLLPGWGGECLDFSLVSLDGQMESSRVRMVESGNNVHSDIAWNGNEYGLSWISYDSTVVRSLDDQGQFITGDGLSNEYLRPDPLQEDGRSSNRSRIGWDEVNQEYAVVTVFSGRLYHQRASTDWTPGSMVQIGDAVANSFAGDLELVVHDGDAYVIHRSMSDDIRLARIDRDGTVVNEVVVQEDNPSGYPSLFVVGNTLFAFTDDAGVPWVHSFDADLQPIVSEQVVDEVRPDARYGWHPESGTLGMVWADGAGVQFQRVDASGLLP